MINYVVIMLGFLKSVSSYDKIYSSPLPSRRSLGKSLKISLGKIRVTIEILIRKHGNKSQTYYRWN